MANLYGIIPLHKAKEIVFSLSPKLVTEDEFLAFAEIARHECEGYYILGGDELYTDVKHTKPLDREIIDVTLIPSASWPTAPMSGRATPSPISAAARSSIWSFWTRPMPPACWSRR